MPETRIVTPTMKELKPDSALEAERLRLGKLGTFFGKGDDVISNVMSLLLLLIIIAGIIVFFFPGGSTPKDYWTIMSPFVTLFTGYLVGRKVEKSRD